MPALLLAGISDGNGKPIKSQTGGPDMASMPGIILEGLAKKHQGALAPASPGYCLMVFEKAASALSCALAAQARFADFNRGKADEKLACVRLTIHQTAAAAGAAVPEKELKTLSLMQEITPAGRVYLTRPVFTQSHGAQACAFIPLGIEYFSGLPEPLDLLEAITIVGATRTLSPAFTSLGTSVPASVAASLYAPPTASGMTAAAPPGPAPLPVFEAFNSPATIGVAAATGLLMSLAAGPLLTLLMPLDFLDWVFHFAGHTMFGMGGDQSSFSVGALLMQAVAPAIFLVHCLWHSRPVAAQLSLFWLGQSLFSIGGHCAIEGGADTNSFGGCIKTDGIELAKSLGMLAHFRAWAHLTAFLGCLVMAIALAGLWVHLRGRQPEAATA